MGRRGITQDDVSAIANKIATSEGRAAVTQRRVRIELGWGSLTTINRMLNVWGEDYKLVRLPYHRREEQLSVKVSSVRDLFDPDTLKLIPSISDKDRKIDCTSGGLHPLVEIVPDEEDLRLVAAMLGIPQAEAITYKINEKNVYNNAYHLNGLRNYVVLGVAFARTHANHMRGVMDELKKYYGLSKRGEGFKDKVLEISNSIQQCSVDISMALMALAIG